jgi:hypothetical protein
LLQYNYNINNNFNQVSNWNNKKKEEKRYTLNNKMNNKTNIAEYYYIDMN